MTVPPRAPAVLAVLVAIAILAFVVTRSGPARPGAPRAVAEVPVAPASPAAVPVARNVAPPPVYAGPRPMRSGALLDFRGTSGPIAVPRVDAGAPLRLDPAAVAVEGTLPRDWVARMALRHESELRACAKESRATGSATLRFVVKGDGTVRPKGLDGPANPALEDCLVESARGWRFPRVPGGEPSTVTLGLAFPAE